MSRWEPDGKGRLAQAALKLYQEQGYEQTTVTEIAERAGLTERTFFRHFQDKREVLFGLQDELLNICLKEIDLAPKEITPIELIMLALESLIPFLQEQNEIIKQRQVVIAANPPLQERDLLKLEKFASALAAALMDRGLTALVANLAASTGIMIFKSAYNRWIFEEEDTELSKLIQEAFDELNYILLKKHTSSH
ncbi:TetR/AcrR family transcriptional regulator [Spirochaeta cellobiosiphila]|uniref:TetR/AcrR family transcriptional regulator n=1 Tax=Spirochaeta cellobiosiphila TaxID=504483 RepID=UPI000413D192|nr:TetR/AcrR family transcriptional regulator [Spirochaeta cellobiosiphila]